MDDLIPGSDTYKKLNVNDNTLAFFLGLLDTIEPIKRMEPKYLKNIDIQLINDKDICIKVLDCNRENEVSEWFKSIKCPEKWSWLDVNISSDSDDKFLIEINESLPRIEPKNMDTSSNNRSITPML